MAQIVSHFLDIPIYSVFYQKLTWLQSNFSLPQSPRFILTPYWGRDRPPASSGPLISRYINNTYRNIPLQFSVKIYCPLFPAEKPRKSLQLPSVD
jgi:hypothetical protein